MTKCATCDGPVPDYPGRGRPRQYCSLPCKRRAGYQRTARRILLGQIVEQRAHQEDT